MATAPAHRTMIQFDASAELRKLVKQIVLDKNMPNQAHLFLPLLAKEYGDQYPGLWQLVAAELAVAWDATTPGPEVIQRAIAERLARYQN